MNKKQINRKPIIILLFSLVIISLYTFFFIRELGQMPNTLTKSDKVYGLSKFWQEVNYNFVYLNKIDRDAWDAEYKRLIDEVQKTQNDYEYYRLLQRFCAMLNDGHTNVYMPKKVMRFIYTSDFGEYRLFLNNIEGKAIVTRINLSKKDEIPIGTEIIKINGFETREFIEKYVKPYISASTEHIRDDEAITNLFTAPKGTTYDIVMKLPNGNEKSFHLTLSSSNKVKIYPTIENRNIFDFKSMENDIAYIALNSFNNRKIDSLFIEKLPELYKAKALIVDLRNNGGGNTGIGFEIFKYLTNDTIIYGSKMESRLHIPAYKAWGKQVQANDTMKSNRAKKSFLSFKDEYYYKFEDEPKFIRRNFKRIVVPTVLLIGHQTASAAEDFLIYADNQKHMVKIGEPTYGSTGQPLLFDLPGGGSARVCTKKDTYPDGREFVGYGIQPDIYVKKTIKDYIDDEDPALEKAIEYLKSTK